MNNLSSYRQKNAVLERQPPIIREQTRAGDGVKRASQQPAPQIQVGYIAILSYYPSLTQVGHENICLPPDEVIFTGDGGEENHLKPRFGWRVGRLNAYVV